MLEKKRLEHIVWSSMNSIDQSNRVGFTRYLKGRSGHIMDMLTN